MANVKKAVMYGAGNIGRGFIGLLFSRSGYEVVFVDIDPTVIECLNRDRHYPVRVVSREGSREVSVRNVRAVDGRDTEAVAEEIAGADIMATAVGVNVLPHIAKPVAEGLKKRWESGNVSPLNIIICENKIDADKYLAELIEKELTHDEIKFFRDRTGLVEASIGRMVPEMTEEMKEGNPLRVWVEPYSRLPVDRDAFKGDMPDIKNMLPFTPFDYYIQRKLFMHNMGHATAAYLGFLKKYTYIWEAVHDPAVKLVVLRALLESAEAMSVEHGMELNELMEHAEDLIFRFGNRLLGDTVDRVGRDPIRKLSSKDRITGAASLCVRHGINPVYIAIGAAAGYMFAPDGDESAAEIRKVVSEKGIKQALRRYSGVDNEGFMELVLEFYSLLKEGIPVADLIDKAEELKNTNIHKVVTNK